MLNKELESLTPEQSFHRMIDVMEKLRDPENGCPWDVEQTWHSLIAYTLEEAYEVADAIENNNESLPEELGDLLFQVVFYSRIAEEQNLFNLQDVINRLCHKLEERHPHVFGNANYSDEELEVEWHKKKTIEREAKNQYSVVDDIPLALPALMRAQKLQRRASNEGFDWRNIPPVFLKLDEEILELKEALNNNDPASIKDEMGDILFTAVNLARHLNLDAESCLRQASAKFERRFRVVEEDFKNSKQSMSSATVAELEMGWDKAKTHIEQADDTKNN